VFRSARRGDIEAVIARFSNGFGAPAALSADCWSLAFPSFCRSAAQDGVVQLSSAGQQQRDFLTLSDMAAAIELLLDAPGASSGDTDVIYNVGGGRSLSMREAAAIVAQEYCELTGERIEVGLPGDALSAPREAAVEYCFDRIAALGYRPKGDLAAEARATLSLLGVGRTPR
jgi:dTDP-glucose 4,6-dehydratase/UDP-glucose 4,6-dehydratase